MRKVALVTGAAAGIGAAVCRRLARDGIAVGVTDIDLGGAEAVAAEIREDGGEAIAIAMDIIDRDQIRFALTRLKETFGPVNILVNNAGITMFKPFLEISDEEWSRVVDVNLRGTFAVTQEAVPDMEQLGWGRIINISSSSAQTGAPTMAPYASSKGGVIALTKTLAQELGPLGITVNNVPPSAVMNTVMSEKAMEDGKFGRFDRETLASVAPVRRVGEPEDIAGACAYLASDEASYVTGQTIGVNGGRVIY